MSRIIKFAKLLRRNWKKSTFFFGVLAYGASYGIERYQTLQMMRAYCEEAKVYGEQVLQETDRPRHITVLLNPEANDQKSSINYEKFAAPLFHLAGFKVSLFKTEGGKQARDLMTIMENTDAVVIAGGNGTVHEAITGLLNRSESEEDVPLLPIGIVPVGKTNTVANYLFSSKASTKPQLLAECAMAVIRETKVSLDVMKIQQGDEKPLFAMSSFETGVFSDLDDIVHKYWYLGPFKDKYLYFKSSLKKRNPMTDYSLEYASPCNGCSRCYKELKKSKTKSGNNERWWHVFIPRATSNNSSEPVIDYSKVTNEACGTLHKLPIPFSNISICSPAVQAVKQPQGGPLWVKVHPGNLSFMEFISSGLSYRTTKASDPLSLCEVVEAGCIYIENLKPDSDKQAVSYKEGDSNQQQNATNHEDSNQQEYSIQQEHSNQQEVSDQHEVSNQQEVSNQREVSNQEEVSDQQDDSNQEEDSLSERVCYIDNEKYKMGPYQITLLPKRVQVYGLQE